MNTIETLELKIAKFLRYGVLVAGVVMLIGWATLFKFKGNPFFNFEVYDPIPLKDLIEHHIKWKDWGVLIAYSGLAALISLPFIRVLLTTFLFIKQKEYALAGIAFIVLCGLALSMSLGIEL